MSGFKMASVSCSLWELIVEFQCGNKYQDRNQAHSSIIN